jgi:hypothetical protein
MMEIEHTIVNREHYTVKGGCTSINVNTTDNILAAVHIGVMDLDGDFNEIEFAGGEDELREFGEQINAVVKHLEERGIE